MDISKEKLTNYYIITNNKYSELGEADGFSFFVQIYFFFMIYRLKLYIKFLKPIGLFGKWKYNSEN